MARDSERADVRAMLPPPRGCVDTAPVRCYRADAESNLRPGRPFRVRHAWDLAVALPMTSSFPSFSDSTPEQSSEEIRGELASTRRGRDARTISFAISRNLTAEARPDV